MSDLADKCVRAPLVFMTSLKGMTPMVLTFNEEANVQRCLERLTWAQQVLVVDSFSTDATLEIVAQFPNARVVQRQFDSFAGQCNYGLTLVETEWVLSLDCDYILEPGFEEEMAELLGKGDCSGYKAEFRYCILGRALRGSLYPARCVMYQKAAAGYEDEGHGHRVSVKGRVGELRSKIAHDDRKPLSRWLSSQVKYSLREAEHLLCTTPSELGKIDRLRARGWLMPWLAPVYCLVVKSLWRDGLAGWHYTLQRWLAECMIALAVLERKLRA